MESTNETVTRLLPWTVSEGKPCVLRTDRAGGFLSRVADRVERELIEMGLGLLEHVPAILDNEKATPEELRFLGRRLAEALRDTLRVAERRGDRLPPADPGEDDEEVRERDTPGGQPT
ncbi:hypothetical protein [Streptomyces sp. NPDC093109]|uniref:hypothetical protein n=1 Tax=Streptomyces sp. NPDC093109 TaxID=3154977 RepID=UPI00344C43D3